MKQKHKGWNNALLLIGVVMLAIAPLVLIRDAEFNGADGQAQAVIEEVKPGYKPWLKPILKPAGKEIESLLFALQAGLGAGVMGYVIGFYRGRKEQAERMKD